MKLINVLTLSDDQLKTLIANHIRQKKTYEPNFRAATNELAKRNSKELLVDKTIEIISKYASDGKFLSYSDINNEYGYEWSKIRYKMNTHLGDVIYKCHEIGAPMLTAIVVNQSNVATGDMNESTISGFLKIARDIGHSIIDEEAFLKEQQQAVFDWAKKRK